MLYSIPLSKEIGKHTMLNSFLMNYIKIAENRIITVKCQVWYAASTGISKN